jgi:hypothetical protein
MGKHRKPPKCPICKTGKLIEDFSGAHCNRRYANRKPCMFATGYHGSPEAYRAYVKTWKIAYKQRFAMSRVASAERRVLKRAREWGAIMDRRRTDSDHALLEDAALALEQAEKDLSALL